MLLRQNILFVPLKSGTNKNFSLCPLSLCGETCVLWVNPKHAVLLQNVLFVKHEDQVVFRLYPLREAGIPPIHLSGDNLEPIFLLIEPQPVSKDFFAFELGGGDPELEKDVFLSRSSVL